MQACGGLNGLSGLICTPMPATGGSTPVVEAYGFLFDVNYNTIFFTI